MVDRLESAFDSVSHRKLLMKLRAYGISDNLFLWIRKFLSNKAQDEWPIIQQWRCDQWCASRECARPDAFLFLLTRAYCTYVRPILGYCSPVWSPHNKQLITKIERVQRFFTRAIPGLRTLPYRSRLQNLELKTPTLHPRFMPLSQNITRIHSLHHPQISRFHVISHTWSYPPSTSRKMLYHS